MNGPYSTQHGTRSPKQQIQNFFQNQRNNNSQQNIEQDSQQYLMPPEQQRFSLNKNNNSDEEEKEQNISILAPRLQRQGNTHNTEDSLIGTRPDFTFTQPNQNEQNNQLIQVFKHGHQVTLIVDKLSKIPKDSKIHPSFSENSNDFQQKIHQISNTLIAQLVEAKQAALKFPDYPVRIGLLNMLRFFSRMLQVFVETLTLIDGCQTVHYSVTLKPTESATTLFNHTVSRDPDGMLDVNNTTIVGFCMVGVTLIMLHFIYIMASEMLAGKVVLPLIGDKFLNKKANQLTLEYEEQKMDPDYQLMKRMISDIPRMVQSIKTQDVQSFADMSRFFLQIHHEITNQTILMGFMIKQSVLHQRPVAQSKLMSSIVGYVDHTLITALLESHVITKKDLHDPFFKLCTQLLSEREGRRVMGEQQNETIIVYGPTMANNVQFLLKTLFNTPEEKAALLKYYQERPALQRTPLGNLIRRKIKILPLK